MDSGLNDFLSQVPAGLIITFCGSGILLVVAIAVMINSRARRAAKRSAAAAGGYVDVPESMSSPINSAASVMSFFSSKGNQSTGSSASGDPYDGADLPDLDVLLNSETFANDASPKRAARSGTFTVTLADGGSVEAVEVLAVLRDVAEGGLLVQIGEKVYRHPPALADAEFKRRYNVTVSELAKSVLGSASPKAPAPSPAIDVANESHVEQPVSAPPPPPVYTPPAITPPPTTAPQMPFDLPKYKLEDAAPAKPQGPLRRPPKPSSQPLPEINVGGSVEAYLQHKLTMTPEFASRSIHIRNAPKGGVVIEVDGRFFETVGDVDDAAARAFLQATIEEWQARQ